MGRGIDIPDITHVILYDMSEVEEYVHRIGRTARGPTGEGYALTFFEYNEKQPKLAGEFIQLLESSCQVVPPELVQIAVEVGQGKRKVAKPKSVPKAGGGGGGKGGKSWGNNFGKSWGNNSGSKK